jgi:hypothetical protein
MSLTGIGSVILAFAIMSILFSPRRLVQGIIFFSSFSATAVINFTNYGMSPAVLLVPAYLVWKAASGEMMRPTQISRDHVLVMLPIVAFATWSTVSLLINQALRNVPTFQVTQTAYILFGVLVTLALSVDLARRDTLEAAIGALRLAAVFIALWGVLQVCCFYLHIPYPTMFNNSSSHFANMFDQSAGTGVIRISSVATEPSFLASSLLIFGSFGATLLTMEARFRTFDWEFPVGLVLLVVAASTSTTGYFGLGVLALLLAIERPVTVLAACGIAALAAIMILWLLPDFADVIYQVTLGKAATGSYTDRSGSVWNALDLIVQQQPWIGWGWGGVVSYSIVTELLTSTGGIGTVCFLTALVTTLTASRAARLSGTARDWRLYAYARAAENAMVVYIAQSAVSGFRFVVADYWCLWAIAIAVPSAMHQR